VQASTVVTLPAVAAAVVAVAMAVAAVSSGKPSSQQAITLIIIQVPHPNILLY